MLSDNCVSFQKAFLKKKDLIDKLLKDYHLARKKLKPSHLFVSGHIIGLIKKNVN